jgi:hypothetical protein
MSAISKSTGKEPDQRRQSSDGPRKRGLGDKIRLTADAHCMPVGMLIAEGAATGGNSTETQSQDAGRRKLYGNPQEDVC